MQCLLSGLSPDKICANKILIPASLVIVILETGPSRWRLNLQLIIETCRAQSELSILHWSPTVLWTMFFFMSLSFFLLTLFSNPWIAPGHKSMWIRHLAYFKILATLYTTIPSPISRPVIQTYKAQLQLDDKVYLEHNGELRGDTTNTDSPESN